MIVQNANSDPAESTPPDPIDRSQERSRLIDHFKRVYTIIVGLALTEACRHVVPASVSDLKALPLLAFFTMFLTIIPIFHGGDRSLDLKYLGAAPGRWWPAYAWDVYMLLLTALFFVGVGESIPWEKEPNHYVGTYSGFYYWLASALIFDLIVLAIDRMKDQYLIKHRAEADDRLKPYPWWMLFNAAFAGCCLWVAGCIGDAMQKGDSIHFPIYNTELFDLSLLGVGGVMLLFALVRTIADYAVSREFLFP